MSNVMIHYTYAWAVGLRRVYSISFLLNLRADLRDHESHLYDDVLYITLYDSGLYDLSNNRNNSLMFQGDVINHSSCYYVFFSSSLFLSTILQWDPKIQNKVDSSS